MTQIWTCPTCRHMIGVDVEAGRYICVAFPDGVPDEIMTGEIDHTQPVDGDHGIRYEPRDDAT